MDSNKFEEKLEKMHDDIVEIKVILSANTATVEHHVKRSDIAEENINMIRKEMEPIKVHVNKVEGGLAMAYFVSKIIAGIATVVGVTIAALQFFRH